MTVHRHGWEIVLRNKETEEIIYGLGVEDWSNRQGKGLLAKKKPVLVLMVGTGKRALGELADWESATMLADVIQRILQAEYTKEESDVADPNSGSS